VEKIGEWVGGRRKKCQIVSRRHQFCRTGLKNKVAKFGEIAEWVRREKQAVGVSASPDRLTTWLFARASGANTRRKFETRPRVLILRAHTYRNTHSARQRAYKLHAYSTMCLVRLLFFAAHIDPHWIRTKDFCGWLVGTSVRKEHSASIASSSHLGHVFQCCR
jgi:hypothetical protein